MPQRNIHGHALSENINTNRNAGYVNAGEYAPNGSLWPLPLRWNGRCVLTVWWFLAFRSADKHHFQAVLVLPT